MLFCNPRAVGHVYFLDGNTDSQPTEEQVKEAMRSIWMNCWREMRLTLWRGAVPNIFSKARGQGQSFACQRVFMIFQKRRFIRIGQNWDAVGSKTST